MGGNICLQCFKYPSYLVLNPVGRFILLDEHGEVFDFEILNLTNFMDTVSLVEFPEYVVVVGRKVDTKIIDGTKIISGENNNVVEEPAKSGENSFYDTLTFDSNFGEKVKFRSFDSVQLNGKS
jgi:hypothetical protein